jgi:hypothetical protein
MKKGSAVGVTRTKWEVHIKYIFAVYYQENIPLEKDLRLNGRIILTWILKTDMWEYQVESADFGENSKMALEFFFWQNERLLGTDEGLRSVSHPSANSFPLSSAFRHSYLLTLIAWISFRLCLHSRLVFGVDGRELCSVVMVEGNRPSWIHTICVHSFSDSIDRLEFTPFVFILSLTQSAVLNSHHLCSFFLWLKFTATTFNTSYKREYFILQGRIKLEFMFSDEISNLSIFCLKYR